MYSLQIHQIHGNSTTSYAGQKAIKITLGVVIFNSTIKFLCTTKGALRSTALTTSYTTKAQIDTPSSGNERGTLGLLFYLFPSYPEI